MTPQPLRYRDPSKPWTSLTVEDGQMLDQLLTNEADMAYRRRVRILIDYLEINDGDRVIDLGCGMGFYLMCLGRLRRLYRLGFDNDFLRLRYAKAENQKLDLVNGLLEDLPFASGNFDKVLLSEVLEHVSDDIHVLKQIHRILKPGGTIAISVPHSNYPLLWDPISRFRASAGLEPLRTGPLVGIWTNHERLYNPDDLCRVLELAGFEVEILEESTHYCFPLSHFLVYGIGKPLFERNLLPTGMRRAADRFSYKEKKGNKLNPVSIGVSIFRWFDRYNDRPAVTDQSTFVNVLAKARKP
jgi:SAM-dependent methyltransferase